MLRQYIGCLLSGFHRKGRLMQLLILLLAILLYSLILLLMLALAKAASREPLPPQQ